MRLRIYERDFEGHTLFSQYEDFEGPSASSIIQAAWDKEIFAETQSLSGYVNLLSERACEEYRIRFTRRERRTRNVPCRRCSS